MFYPSISHTIPTSSSDSRIVPSDDPPGEFELPVVISEEPDEFKDDTELSELSETPNKESISLLELTAQREDERKRVFRGFMGIPMTRSLWIRMVKSSILVATRSARICTFRAFQRAPPEERERMRWESGGTRGGSRGEQRTTWTAVHLLSAEEVKSLFGDVVEGLAFLMSFFRMLCLGGRLTGVIAWQINIASSFEARKRAVNLG